MDGVQDLSETFDTILDQRHKESGSETLEFLSIKRTGESTEYVAQIICLLTKSSSIFPSLEKIKISESIFYNQLYHFSTLILPMTKLKVNNCWFYYYDEQFLMEKKIQDDITVNDQKSFLRKAKRNDIRDVKYMDNKFIRNFYFLDVTSISELSFYKDKSMSESSFSILFKLLNKFSNLKFINLAFSLIFENSLNMLFDNAPSSLSAVNCFKTHVMENPQGERFFLNLNKAKLIFAFMQNINSQFLSIFQVNNSILLYVDTNTIKIDNDPQ